VRANRPRSVVRNEEVYFKEGFSWSRISISIPSFRYFSSGFIIGDKGPAIYVKGTSLHTAIAYMNSCVVRNFLGILSPAVGFEIGQVRDLPFREPGPRPAENAVRLIEIHQHDWDSFENSWSFQGNPLLNQQGSLTIEASVASQTTAAVATTAQVKQLEEENNRLFIDAYGLQAELSPEVPDDQITLYRPDREEDIKRLLSYAVGCMMGRYSLDKPGLVYAHAGNEGFDPGQYKTFPADPDGILPLTELDWGFPDDPVKRVEEFVSVAWPKEHLAENLQFIEDGLGEPIRKYLATGFYKDHLRWYKRRPIYWLFNSGKQRAFQCLVYLHRYHEGTLARMRTEYVIPLQGRIAARIEQLENEKNNAKSASRRNQIQKEIDKLVKQQAELRGFDERLRHMADQRIKLDLDDGVKVNYAKFGDLLAEVKAVTGGKDEE